jgi:predicted nucleic acid-binding protein
MSDDGGATPTPWVVDAGVLVAVARNDHGIMTLIQDLDAGDRPLVIPVLAMTAASLEVRSEETEALLHGLEQLSNTMTAPLRDAEQAAALADVIARTGLDPWDAHAAAVADAAVCPVLTLNAGKWRELAGELDEPLYIIEIADLGEG